MNVAAVTPDIIYPETDDLPMGDNTIQVQWMTLLFFNIDCLFLNRPDVFAAMNLFWYPVEGQSKIVSAPDVMVAFDRPKGNRPSYLQWEEDGIAPQVVFEILSPSNSDEIMAVRFRFFEQYGVEEYYIYDPLDGTLQGYRRSRNRLVSIRKMHDFTSPRLGIRFDLSGPVMEVIRPDGKRFENYYEVVVSRQENYLKAEKDRLLAEDKIKRAEDAKLLADEQAKRAEDAKLLAEIETEKEKRRADAATKKLQEMLSLLREHGIDPDHI